MNVTIQFISSYYKRSGEPESSNARAREARYVAIMPEIT